MGDQTGDHDMRILGAITDAHARHDAGALFFTIASTPEEAVAGLRDLWEVSRGTGLAAQSEWLAAERENRENGPRTARYEIWLVPLGPRGKPPAPPVLRRASAHPAAPPC